MPSFGGSPATWAACLLFFQTMLLVGYAYAHASSRLPPRLHLGLHVIVALAALSGIVHARNLPELTPSDLPPAFEVGRVLLSQVGAAYLLLFSTAPLLQRWAAWRRMRAPHRLYAVSNAGSLLALLSYPAWIEASLSLPMQYRVWSIACGAFAIAHIGCAVLTFRSAPTSRAPASALPPSAARGVYWSVCAFVPSLFLLAATNHITVDIAPTPLFWVLPLALYLLSFILAFAGKVTAWRGWLAPLFVVATIGLGYNAFAEGSASLFRQLLFSLGALFIAALFCHDALVRARPSDEALTGFYLWIAFGGALGGLFVSLIAPLIWNDYYELELATLLSYGLLLFSAR
ncbi:MAG TPA: hypothetical protein VHZ95_04940, partial [Polyangiales bacterium]|nr:hypothetical protein [Polyangiales bacterium]